MSDFIVAAALEKADQVSASIERWELDSEDSRVVMAALLNPQTILVYERSLQKIRPRSRWTASSREDSITTVIHGFTIEALAQHHQRGRFHCSRPSLDDFIQKRAKAHNANDTTRVHVLADEGGRIAGFYTLSAHLLELHGLPESIQKDRPRFPIPATLIGRFAVDNEFAGKGVGRWLLAHAL